MTGAGILVRNDLDRAEGRFDYEQIGAFPNYINHADMRYGGGRVSIASVERVIDPVHLVDARADVSFNEITFSADAAISVNPDAFEETRFPRSGFAGHRLSGDTVHARLRTVRSRYPQQPPDG